ncbi:lanthionine synthetase LanC family protein [Paraprevotella clara]|uniref:lanthionine synthetase LanC family protein n=1 Tax=Paraprevotella clara TaxID=454154 RepID=UPI002675F89A|nr:lanthionine synthetase LanC family protein [Paraprevotella clara]
MNSYKIGNKIANYILLQGSYIKDASLYHGKMGLSLALFFWGRKTKNPIFERYASNLLEDVYDLVHVGMPIGIEYGLSGIALGITYLYKAQFVQCNLNDILSDIDQKIMEYSPQRIKDHSFRTGLQGIIEYIQVRKSTREPVTTFDKYFLQELSSCTSYGIKNRKDKFYFINDLKAPKDNINKYLGNKLDIDEGIGYYLIKESYERILSHQ